MNTHAKNLDFFKFTSGYKQKCIPLKTKKKKVNGKKLCNIPIDLDKGYNIFEGKYIYILLLM